MEIMQCHSSGASEDTDLSHSHFCLHHSFQHHLSSTPDILSPTRECHGHPTYQILPHPSSFTSIHPLHHTHLCSPSIWNFLCTFCKKNHWSWIRNIAFAKDRSWPLFCYLFHGFCCHYGEEEKGCGCRFKQDIVHLLDHPTVSNIWIVRNAHCCWSHRVLLQTVFKRDASILNSYHILLLLVWFLLELLASFFGEQGHLLKLYK